MAFEHFRSHIDWRSQHGFSKRLVRLQIFAEAKISNFDLAVMKENILGFQIPMHNIIAVEHFESSLKLREYLQGALFLKFFIFLDILLKCSFIAEFINKIIIILANYLLIVFDDVGTAADHGKHFYLIIDTFLQFLQFLKFLNRNDFDCKKLGIRLMLGLEDISVAACPYFLQKGVVLDDLFHILEINVWELLLYNKHSNMNTNNIQMELRIKKRPSIKKPNGSKEKPMNMTTTSAMFSCKDLKEPRLPPLRPNLRKTSTKFTQKTQNKERQKTETTLDSEMFQSYYQTMSKGWIKPSQYIKDIKQIYLINDPQISVSNYQIKLTEKMQKNMSKIQSLFKLMQRWISILKKVINYTTSKKANTPNLAEEVKFWRILSKKFDQLQYEFNNEKTSELIGLMKNSLKAKPEYRKQFEEFLSLRDKIILLTPALQKLYLSLEETVSGTIQRFQQNSNIVISINYLIKCLLNFQIIAENNPMLENRLLVIYDKMNSCMIQKLSAAPIYPRQLANISSIKQKYQVIDKALSFYSNFIAILEEYSYKKQSSQIQQIIESGEYAKVVLVNLLQILGYFEYLYRKKQVLEFSKLFSCRNLEEYSIFDIKNQEEWEQYMEKVNRSMEVKKYQP